MFLDAATAARIERGEARLTRAIGETLRGRDLSPPAHVADFADGGAAVFARPGSPLNKLIGVGFGARLDADLLGEVEAVWHARGEPVRVELASLVDPAVVEQLGARGYRLLGCEHVLVRRLTAADADAPVAHAVHRDHPAWCATLVAGFLAPDGTGVTADDYGREIVETIMRDFADAPGFLRYVATVDGEVAGAATLRVDDGVALFCGAATLPAFRRRGVQAALVAARLRDAARAGCDLAALTTSPGSLSQHNATRQGFSLAYTRTLLTLPPPAK